MEGNKTGLLIGALVLVLMTAGCQKSAEEELGPGTFEGSSYRNEYLGLTYTTEEQRIELAGILQTLTLTDA